jgi:hypothetical protein
VEVPAGLCQWELDYCCVTEVLLKAAKPDVCCVKTEFDTAQSHDWVDRHHKQPRLGSCPNSAPAAQSQGSALELVSSCPCRQY